MFWGVLFVVLSTWKSQTKKYLDFLGADFLLELKILEKTRVFLDF